MLDNTPHVWTACALLLYVLHALALLKPSPAASVFRALSCLAPCLASVSPAVVLKTTFEGKMQLYTTQTIYFPRMLKQLYVYSADPTQARTYFYLKVA